MLTNNYHNAVRAHVDLLVRRSRFDQLIVWDVKNDESTDPTLVAIRAYGSRNDTDIVILCAGTNRIGEPLPIKRIYLPTAASLIQIKRQQSRRGLIANGQ